ncbi:hypothetical protein GCM10008983_20500 [Lentibacillus halophilus]|uniref:DUF2624 domain-containing protein n=1 Tax=Lentibacillus halophilus TaxID=295065 RepID=A0ABN0ZCE9_9BACI
MSTFIRQVVRNKLKRLTTDEILQYAHNYHFSVTRNQAEAITDYLQEHTVDPFSPHSREKMLQELARITDQHTADKAQKLFEKMIQSYGLEHLFQ